MKIFLALIFTVTQIKSHLQIKTPIVSVRKKSIWCFTIKIKKTLKISKLWDWSKKSSKTTGKKQSFKKV